MKKKINTPNKIPSFSSTKSITQIVHSKTTTREKDANPLPRRRNTALIVSPVFLKMTEVQNYQNLQREQPAAVDPLLGTIQMFSPYTHPAIPGTSVISWGITLFSVLLCWHQQFLGGLPHAYRLNCRWFQHKVLERAHVSSACLSPRVSSFRDQKAKKQATTLCINLEISKNMSVLCPQLGRATPAFTGKQQYT